MQKYPIGWRYGADKEREAAKRVATALQLPIPEDNEIPGCEGMFDPWEIFPCFYGSYSSEFDDMALETLRNIRDKSKDGETLAHDMFREYLCRAHLCEYGTSPRYCFPTLDFAPLLTPLVEKWETYSQVAWPKETA